MKQSTKRFLSIVVSFALWGAAFIIYYSFTQSQYEDTQRMRAELLGKKDFIARQRQIVSQVTGLIEQFNGEKEARDTVSRVLPLKPELAEALAQITTLLQVSQLANQGVSVSLSAPQAVTRASAGERTSLIEPLATIQFQVRATGSYESVKQFLGNMERNIRFFEATTFSIQPDERTSASSRAGGTPLFSLDASLTTYYQP